VSLFTLWIPEANGKTLEEIEAGVMYGDEMEIEVSEESIVASKDSKFKAGKTNIASESVASSV
jgi:hypothetical protein